MKIVGLIVVAFTLVAIGIASFLFLTGYRSAFEADQACHALQWDKFKDKPGYGCDHDIETRQWLLFRKGEDHIAADIVARFRY